MDRTYAIRFSDESYLSKDEIKKVLNIMSVDHIWDTVEEYRKLYIRYMDLFSLDRKPYYFSFTPGISNSLLKLEKRLTRFELVKYRLNYNEYLINAKLDILSLMRDFNAMNEGASDALLTSIAENNIESIPQQYQILRNYMLALDEIATCSSSPLNELTLRTLYTILLRGDKEQLVAINKMYRETDLGEKEDLLNIAPHLYGCPCENIQNVMDVLFDEIREVKLFSISEACAVFYYIIYMKPFETFNEEMALLMAKYLLTHEGDDVSYLNLERILFKLGDNDYKKILMEIDSSYDLTYMLVRFVKEIDDALKNAEQFFKAIQEKQIESEVLTLDVPSFDVKEKQLVSVPYDNRNQVEGVKFERKISLPVIPSGLEETEVSLVANNLMELCPTLRKHQAEFYARHCTVGKYYTIQQFKNEFDVAYETARTSMDNLAALGFYKKEKINNKFVYTPVIRS